MSACLRQILYWNKTLVAYQKCIKRRNKLIRRLRNDNEALAQENRELMLEIAKLTVDHD